ncbi:MAG: hypothetical protein FJ211_04555 [Ignavibacteria bacterium]|nr:hypothetical protein [Ignavibacteria bacterium]
MKLILESIDVAQHQSTPSIICWRGGTYSVESVIDVWSTRGRWWSEDETRNYIVLMTSSGVMEIYKSNLQGWVLSRMYD